ncbi:MAG: right-handed parallel beta-helix repeat-containing protein [Methanothrix sp.]
MSLDTGPEIYRKHGTQPGVIEDNEIYGNVSDGVVIKEGNPTLKNNKIHDGKHVGILVSENGRGVIEDNDIYDNAWGGIDIVGGNPIIRLNRINKNRLCAIWISGECAGTIEDNDLRNNSSGALIISKDSKFLGISSRNLEK